MQDSVNTKNKMLKLRLYVAGHAPNSILARSNLLSLCKDWLNDCCDLEIVDVLEEPGRAFQDNVIVTPTLIKLAPAPVLNIVGNLSDRQLLAVTFGLDAQQDVSNATQRDSFPVPDAQSH